MKNGDFDAQKKRNGKRKNGLHVTTKKNSFLDVLKGNSNNNNNKETEKDRKS